MSMIEINTNPSRKELQWFGALFAVFWGIIGGAAGWKFGATQVATVIWTAAAVVTILYYLIVPLRRPLYIGWICAAWPIGWTVSHLILAITFYLVITPLGWLMRLCGYDPLRRRPDRSTASYWTERPRSPDPSRYFRQF